MIKSNPLFHDSTVTQGANVQTQFEVLNVELQEGQKVCLKLTIGDQLRFIEMTPKGEGAFHTSAWIEHRKKIVYQFFIQTLKGDKLVKATPEKEALALHTVVEKWQSLETEDWKEGFKTAPEFADKEMHFVEPPKKEATEDFLDGLIDKWDL